MFQLKCAGILSNKSKLIEKIKRGKQHESIKKI